MEIFKKLYILKFVCNKLGENIQNLSKLITFELICHFMANISI